MLTPPAAAAPIRAYLGLGSNLGNRRDNLRAALDALAADGRARPAAVSAFYETEPWGYREQPPFLNGAVAVDTLLSPVNLLELCQSIERRRGRQASGRRYGPRVIDLDILLYGSEIVARETPDLQIPHPRLPLRAFALLPLAEIAGEVLHPVLNRAIGELAAAVEGREGVVRVDA